MSAAMGKVGVAGAGIGVCSHCSCDYTFAYASTQKSLFMQQRDASRAARGAPDIARFFGGKSSIGTDVDNQVQCGFWPQPSADAQHFVLRDTINCSYGADHGTKGRYACSRASPCVSGPSSCEPATPPSSIHDHA